MSDPPLKRKLAAMLSADVVEYSRLMGANEAATVATLKDYQAAINQVITRHSGRVVNSPGDSLLAEFSSAVEAVQCAVEIQQVLTGRNVGLPSEQRMRFRIGINVGDVIEEADGTLYGDGVNIAARMQELADGGGVCISSTAYDAVEGKLTFGFEFLGKHQVKNIAKPLRVYRVRAGPRSPPARRRVWRGRKSGLIASVAVLVLIAGGVAAWQTMRDPPSMLDPTLALPSGPSIAVLPFTNLTGDAGQEYFVDGVTEDIITELSRFQAFRVIARNSTFRFKGQAVDVRKVGEDLGARYVVEGSVRRTPTRIRVTVQLLDAADGRHVWSRSYDRDLTAQDVFAIQDETANMIAATIGDVHGVLARTIGEQTRRRRTDELSSYECVLRLHEYNRIVSAELHRAALDCLQQTVQRDPRYADAWASLAEVYVDAHMLGYNPVEDPLDKAFDAAKRALAIDPTHQQGQWARAYVYFARRDLQSYLVNMEKVVELNPNNGYYVGAAGWAIAHSGQCERGRELVDKAIKLNPYNPGWWHFPFVVCHYSKGEYELALAEAQKIQTPDFFWTPLMFAAIYGQTGRQKEAEQALEEALRLNPDVANRPRFYTAAYVFPEESINKLLDGLHKAGLVIPVEEYTAESAGE